MYSPRKTIVVTPTNVYHVLKVLQKAGIPLSEEAAQQVLDAVLINCSNMPEAM